MKILSNILLIIFFTGIIFGISCKKPETYPVVPYIEFVSFTKTPTTSGIDSKGILTFSFTDGDGDIGLADSDTLSPYNPGSKFYYDLFITYYRKHNGVFLADSLPMTNNSRIPVVTPSGQNKSIKGDIDVDLFINNPRPQVKYDTIYFEVQIADRALNLSNTIKTSEIIVKKQ